MNIEDVAAKRRREMVIGVAAAVGVVLLAAAMTWGMTP